MIKKSLILLLGSLFLVASCDSSSTNDHSSVDNTSSSTTLDNSETISNSSSSEDSGSSNTSSSVSTLNEYQTPDGFASSFSAGYNFDVTNTQWRLPRNEPRSRFRVLPKMAIRTEQKRIHPHYEPQDGKVHHRKEK